MDPQKATTIAAIATNQCEADIACLCRNDEFLSKLVRAILRGCNKVDQDSRSLSPLSLCLWYWRSNPGPGHQPLEARKGCLANHLTEALGIAQGLCSIAIPSLNDNQQGKIIAIVVVMTFASTLAVVLRLVARYLSTAKYGYDDLFIVIALVSHAFRRRWVDTKFMCFGI